MERHSAVALAALALGAEIALALAGGGPAAAAGAAVLLAAGLLVGRYALGAEGADSRGRDRVHLRTAREPTVRQLAAAIEESLTNPDGYEWRLRPVLERLYAARLAERHAVSLHAQPARAAALVGAELWPWIDPARPRDTDPAPPPSTARRSAYPRPVPAEVLSALVEGLERLDERPRNERPPHDGGAA